MRALGLGGPLGGDDRPLTVTGGLGFAGGPANNYPTHAIAAMVDACRQDPGSIGMVSALGWYATKHSVGLYSTDAPGEGLHAASTKATRRRGSTHSPAAGVPAPTTATRSSNRPRWCSTATPGRASPS